MSHSNPMHHDHDANNPGPRRHEKITPIKPEPYAVDVPAINPEAITEIRNMDGFASLILAWHAAAIADAENLLKIPEDATVEYAVNGSEPTTVVLEGASLLAFQAGVVTVLTLLGKLPFETIEETNAD